MKRRKRPKNSKKKMRWDIGKLWKGKKLPVSIRYKISKTKKEKFASGQYSKKHLRKPRSKEWRKKLSIARKEYYKKNPWARIIARERQKKLMANPRVKAKMIASQKKLWSAEKRKLWGEKTRKLYEERPEVLRKIRRKAIEFSKAHPNQGKIFYYKTYFHLLVDKKAREKVEANRKNPHKRIIPSMLGKVRSKYEKRVADYLANLNNYKAEYETKRLYFEGYESNPDFFVTNKKKKSFICTVEMFGDHPDARKKAREKRYYYEKYKIPVVIISPAEIYNLDYCLLREIKKLEKSRYARKSYVKNFENPLYTIKKSKTYAKLKQEMRKNPLLKKELRKILRMIREEKGRKSA